jgi:putative Holliday junction resolvase
VLGATSVAKIPRLRTLAIDYGEKRVGLAVGGGDVALASAIGVLEVSSPEDAVRKVARAIADEEADEVLVGLPLNMDGTFGPAGRKVVQWGKSLAAACGKRVMFVDERLSSFAAEEKLVDRKRHGQHMTRAGKKRRLDALAAAEFLGAYLEGRLAAIDVDSLDGM